MEPIRLLLVDDHEIVRAGLRALLGRRVDLEVVGEAANGQEAIELTAQLKPDVVLMDVSLPDISGADATREILDGVSQANVLALSVHEEEAYFFQMLQAGACGYVPKRTAPDLLLTAIKAAAQGEFFLDPSVAGVLVNKCLRQRESDRKYMAYDGLTDRQRQVLRLIAEGFSSAEIAERLDVSIGTVQRHCRNIRKRLNLRGRVGLVKYALRKGLVELDDVQ